jgi:hypothetical protein
MNGFPVFKAAFAGLSLFTRPRSAFLALLWLVLGAVPYLAFIFVAIDDVSIAQVQITPALFPFGIFAVVILNLLARVQGSWQIYGLVLGPQPGAKRSVVAPFFRLWFLSRRTRWRYFPAAILLILGILGGSVAGAQALSPWNVVIPMLCALPGLAAILYTAARMSLVRVIAYAEPATLDRGVAIDLSWARTKAAVAPLMITWALVFLIDAIVGAALIGGLIWLAARGGESGLFAAITDTFSDTLDPGQFIPGGPANWPGETFVGAWIAGVLSAAASPIFASAASAEAYRALTPAPAAPEPGAI